MRRFSCQIFFQSLSYEIKAKILSRSPSMFAPIAVPAGEAGGNYTPSFQNLGKIMIFRAVTENVWAKPKFFGQRYENFAQNQEF